MKPITKLSILYIVLVITACTKKNQNCEGQDILPQKLDTVIVQSSIKGWELYSWPGDVQECNAWNYSILLATNRLKSYNEVTNDTILFGITGEKQLKLLLNKFPVNESILWVGENWLSNIWSQNNISYGNLKFPPPSVINEIDQHCNQVGLNLIVSQ